MTTTQAIRAERRRVERMREAKAKQVAAQTVLILIVITILFSLAACVSDGTSDADLIEQEAAQWAALGVNVFE